MKRARKIKLQLVGSKISAGFPSPADDFKTNSISLDQDLIQNPESTFYARVSGNSMENAGISDEDLIVIDKSINPQNNKIAVCFLDGEFTIKRIMKRGNKLYLKPENRNFKEIEISEENNLIIWGIVTYVIKKLS